MLVYKRLVRRFGARQDKWKANALTSPYLVVIAAFTILPATAFWSHTGWLQLVAVAFTAFYVWIYWRIVRFRVPRLLVLRRTHA